MSAIEITHDIFEKYHCNGKLRLSCAYVQECVEHNGYPGHDGIVQVVKGKSECGDLLGVPFSYRLRINDGIFEYNTVISADLYDQVKADEEHFVEGTMIAITDCDVVPAAEGKPPIYIKAYKVLSCNHAIMNHTEKNRRAHPGTPDAHRGYKPTHIFEDDWPEAASVSPDHTENMANPPAAKARKIEVEEEAPRSRMPVAPEPARARPAPPTAPPPRRAPSKTEGGAMPISAVTPYVNNLKIHGVITRKEEMRVAPAKNTKIFNFEITDSAGDTIRCVAFNEQAESFFTTIVEGLPYFITSGTVRQANKKFNNTGHDYEITIRADTKIEPGQQLTTAPKLNLKRVKLSEIASHLGQNIDILVVVEKIDAEATEFTSRNGKALVKRELELIDDSNTQVRLTIWGEDAKKINVEDYHEKVFAFKGVMPKEYNGAYSLSLGGGSRTIPVPDIEGVADLYDWYHSERSGVEVKQISQMSSGLNEAPRTIAGLQEMRFGEGAEKGDYASVKAMITRINPANALYKGCPSESCQKKVNENDGEYRCEKCARTMPTFKWLYMMQFELSDETGQVYVTAFGETAAKIVGKSAAEMGELKEENEDEYRAIFERLQFVPKMWRLRCKMESYNEETRQRMTVYRMDDVDQDKYIANLQELIEQMNSISEDN